MGVLMCGTRSAVRLHLTLNNFSLIFFLQDDENGPLIGKW